VALCKDIFYTKNAFVEIYNFLVINFLFEVIKMLKNTIIFQQHINQCTKTCLRRKSYLSYIVSNKDLFYTKIISLDEIYNFLVLSFFI